MSDLYSFIPMPSHNLNPIREHQLPPLILIVIFWTINMCACVCVCVCCIQRRIQVQLCQHSSEELQKMKINQIRTFQKLNFRSRTKTPLQ
jgi:hypothetical protein